MSKKDKISFCEINSPGCFKGMLFSLIEINRLFLIPSWNRILRVEHENGVRTNTALSYHQASRICPSTDKAIAPHRLAYIVPPFLVENISNQMWVLLPITFVESKFCENLMIEDNFNNTFSYV